MTCNATTTIRRPSVPALLLALREAEQAEAAAWDDYLWARGDDTRPAGQRDLLVSLAWGRLEAAREAVRYADAAHWRATSGEE